MKKIVSTLILLATFFLFTSMIMAQTPPHPPADPTAGGNQAPSGPLGGAPLDPGTGIFLILAAGYGLTKIRKVIKTAV
jgi:hypothetical protein